MRDINKKEGEAKTQNNGWSTPDEIETSMLYLPN